jgi:para-aminobenzoate synthetase component 1
MLDKIEHDMNQMGESKTPFLFMFDFELKKPFVVPLHGLDSSEIVYSMNDSFLDYRNYQRFTPLNLPPLKIKKFPITFEKFNNSFQLVLNNLLKGNSFLTNLTAETPIESNWDLETLFFKCRAKYKLFWKDKFLCFSPETFIQIDKSGLISSFPMKGTIDARIKNAEEIILNDVKEKYEHTTIVDLIRNDLSRIANKVWVERFRYIDKITKEDGSNLLQVSSEVCGKLDANWNTEIGTLLLKLLPAGSISGAPKPKTIEIIQEAEKTLFQGGKRGYYTGVFGVFDGEKLNSAVMIRFIEKKENSLVFKSGGGITSRSEAKKEYQELLSKIYVPVF